MRSDRLRIAATLLPCWHTLAPPRSSNRVARRQQLDDFRIRGLIERCIELADAAEAGRYVQTHDLVGVAGQQRQGCCRRNRHTWVVYSLRAALVEAFLAAESLDTLRANGRLVQMQLLQAT